MSVLRGMWVVLILGSGLQAFAEPNHSSGAGSARPEVEAAERSRIFSEALNACGLSRAGGALLPPPVFTGGVVAKPEPPLVFAEEPAAPVPADTSAPGPSAGAQASTGGGGQTAKPPEKPATPTPPAGSGVISQSEALKIMSKVNCKGCHSDGRTAAADPQGAAIAFTKKAAMKNKLSADEVAKLGAWVKSQVAAR